MKQEFNLSEREGWFKANDGKIHKVYFPKYIKEFIKRLKELVKEECMGTSANCHHIGMGIDKLAGDKLKNG